MLRDSCWYKEPRFERHNSAALPDQAYWATLLNETSGQVQQRLQLLAGANQTRNRIKATIMAYYRAEQQQAPFSKTQATQQAPSSSVGTSYNGGAALMGIGAINIGKATKEQGKARKITCQPVSIEHLLQTPTRRTLCQGLPGGSLQPQQHNSAPQVHSDPTAAWWTDDGQAYI